MAKYRNGGGGYKSQTSLLLEINPLSILFLFYLLSLCLARGKIILFFHNSPKSTLNSLSLRILCSRANHVERHWRRALSPFHGFDRQAAAGFLPASLQSYEELTAQIKEGKVLALT
ncbi:hypothetical protein MHOCP_17160 [Moorella humiferrea]|uniref:hypothetical protein n=1 Tax=Neomoorella humiferrea TaxID=676965 RepID=UPI0030D0AABD